MHRPACFLFSGLDSFLDYWVVEADAKQRRQTSIALIMKPNLLYSQSPGDPVTSRAPLFETCGADSLKLDDGIIAEKNQKRSKFNARLDGEGVGG